MEMDIADLVTERCMWAEVSHIYVAVVLFIQAVVITA